MFRYLNNYKRIIISFILNSLRSDILNDFETKILLSYSQIWPKSIVTM
jgi:Zn-finger domain-containing protein